MKNLWFILSLAVISVTILIIVLTVSMTEGIGELTDEFFSHISKKDYQSAYELTSGEFQSKTNLVQFRQFFQATSLSEYLSSEWKKEEITNGQGSIGGIIRAAEGGEIPVTLRFTKENGNWRVLRIEKESPGFDTKNVINNLPSETEVLSLLDNTFVKLTKAIRSDNFSELYGTISLLWQSQINADKFKAIFNEFLNKSSEFATFIKNKPHITQNPKLIEERTFHVAGRYNSGNSSLNFELLFIYEKPEWKLFGIKLILN